MLPSTQLSLRKFATKAIQSELAGRIHAVSQSARSRSGKRVIAMSSLLTE
eukprot:SAG22_NODE_2054_length_3070_cov_1.685291_2_plen_50_part_00